MNIHVLMLGMLVSYAIIKKNYKYNHKNPLILFEKYDAS